MTFTSVVTTMIASDTMAASPYFPPESASNSSKTAV